jgi:hypothetical protein
MPRLPAPGPESPDHASRTSPPLPEFGQPFSLPPKAPGAAAAAWAIADAYLEGHSDGANEALEPLLLAHEAAEAAVTAKETLRAGSMGRLEQGLYGRHVLAEPPSLEEPEPKPVAEEAPREEAPHVVFGTWVFNSDRGRAERARDSVGSHQDRQFDRAVAIAAARAHVRRLRKQGLPRPERPARDGYLPGHTPPKSDRWRRAMAETVLFEEHGLSLVREVSLESPMIQKAFDDREPERILEAKAKRAADFAKYEADQRAITETEIAEFKASEEGVVAQLPKRRQVRRRTSYSTREYERYLRARRFQTKVELKPWLFDEQVLQAGQAA